jgi:hypothetical protein
VRLLIGFWALVLIVPVFGEVYRTLFEDTFERGALYLRSFAGR